MFSESNFLQSYVSEYIGLLDDCINEHLQRSFRTLINFASTIKSYLLSKFFDLDVCNDDYLSKFKQISNFVRDFLKDSYNKEQQFLQKCELQFTGGQIQVKDEKRDIPRTTPIQDILSGIPKNVISKCLASKPTALAFFSQKLGLYMPKKKDCNISFIRGLLNGTKKAFKQSQVNHIHVPLYEEFQVDKSWKQLQTDQKFMQYMPYRPEERPNKQFFYNIYNTLYPNKLPDLITKAYVKRNLDSQGMRRKLSTSVSQSSSSSPESSKQNYRFKVAQKVEQRSNQVQKTQVFDE